jgi:hypothetical protein
VRWSSFRGGLLTILFVASALSPFYYRGDMDRYWHLWQEATAGLKPWNVYDLPKCNYPPVVLYLLSATEWVRGALELPRNGYWNQLLIKLPNVLAHALGAVVLFRWMRRRAARSTAWIVAGAWSMNLAVLANTAFWGQFDALLMLPIVFGVLAASERRWLLCGLALSVALSIKMLAIFAVIPLAAFVLRHDPRRGTTRALLGALLGLILCFGPIAIGGAIDGKGAFPIRRALRTYLDNTTLFPARTVGAWNIWHAYDVRFMNTSRFTPTEHLSDELPLLNRESFPSAKLVGIVAYAAVSGAIALQLLRIRRSANSLEELALLTLAVTISAASMFLLLTRMHERYCVYAAALLPIMLLTRTPSMWTHFAIWSVSAAVNQMVMQYHYMHLASSPLPDSLLDRLGLTFGLAMGLSLLLMLIQLSRLPRDKSPTSAPSQPPDL